MTILGYTPETGKFRLERGEIVIMFMQNCACLGADGLAVLPSALANSLNLDPLETQGSEAVVRLPSHAQFQDSDRHFEFRPDPGRTRQNSVSQIARLLDKPS